MYVTIFIIVSLWWLNIYISFYVCDTRMDFVTWQCMDIQYLFPWQTSLSKRMLETLMIPCGRRKHKDCNPNSYPCLRWLLLQMKMTRITEKEDNLFGDLVWRFRMEAVLQIHCSHWMPSIQPHYCWKRNTAKSCTEYSTNIWNIQ